MYRFINLFKTVLKKYLPSFLYFFFYRLFKYTRFLISKKTESDKRELSLTKFTKPLLRKVTLDDISFLIKLNPENGLVDKEIYAKGVWEADLLREIRKHITDKSICLDVGANIGQHTLYMASVARNGKVYAFDPLPQLAAQIKESINENGMQHVEVCEFGLSNTNETLDIYLNNLNMGNTTFKKRLGASSVIKAETKIFDEFWAKRGPIDFIKIDVEGYEYYSLLGMKESLTLYKPTMIIEFSPVFYNKMNIKNEDILTFLFDLGYRLYDLDDAKREIRKQTIPHFLKRVEVQTNILCTQTKLKSK